MTPTEQKSLLSIAMLAAFADQSKTDRERDEVRQVAESLGSDLNVAAIYQDVLLGRAGVESAAASLSTPALRQLAYEIAIGVCDADGLRNEAETRFLARLGAALGLNQPAMDAAAVEADALAVAPLEVRGDRHAPHRRCPRPSWTGTSSMRRSSTAHSNCFRSPWRPSRSFRCR